MRCLVIDEKTMSEVKRVKDFAEDPGNYYIVGKGGFSYQRPPGDDPRHVCKLEDGYRCVFSMTVSDGVLWRHFSISVPGEKYPNPFAAFTVAEMFGFTGWDGKSEKPSDEWIIKISEEEHCIVIAEKEIKHPFGQAARTTVANGDSKSEGTEAARFVTKDSETFGGREGPRWQAIG